MDKCPKKTILCVCGHDKETHAKGTKNPDQLACNNISVGDKKPCFCVGFKAKRAPRPGEGRPPITTDALPADWQQQILFMSAQGMSAVEIRANLCTSGKPGTPEWRFHHKVWDALKERDAEFGATVQKGQALCQAWWEAIGRTMSDGTHSKDQVFETGLWYANMKNRFGWKDKTENSLPDEQAELLAKYATLPVNELLDRLSKLMPKK